MNNYLTELAVVHMVLFIAYWFFLRKERQYDRMRAYLIASTLLALAIPLLKLPKLFTMGEDPALIPMETISMDVVSIAPSAEGPGWGYMFLLWTYLVISSFFLLKLLSSIFYLIWLERKSHRELVNGLTIRRVADIKGSFTFFNWIFLSDKIDPRQRDYEVILKHEKAHAALGHTYDLLFFGLFKSCFWWLPTAWIVLKEIKKIHEYQADAVAIKTCDVDRYSSILISSTLKTNGLTLASSFHDGLILKRLKAMKQKAKNVSPWKLGALSVLCTSLVIALACSEEKADNNAAQDKVFTVVEAYPELDGGIEAFYNHIRREIKYPLQAREAGVEGRVDVEFVIDKDGSVSSAEVVNGIGAGCDEEAVRVVKSLPRFKPATQNGRTVRVRMVVPVVFQLKAGETNADQSTQGMIIVEQLQNKNNTLTVETNYTNGEWRGTVYDEEGNGLPGANVVVRGTSNGATTGPDGTFKLKADQSQRLVVSFVGYETVEIRD